MKGKLMFKIYIDTTSRYEKSVILFKDGQEVTRVEGDIDIVASISRVLEENKLSLEDISEIEPNPGPGSFTGIKIGIVIANVLNWISGKKDLEELADPFYGGEPNIQF
ncbi:hypothetical protein GF360_01270 [candidate division WWE3 bacterium]|nr:hypothetical protein [candidate division WWE3 bacterium]